MIVATPQLWFDYSSANSNNQTAVNRRNSARMRAISTIVYWRVRFCTSVCVVRIEMANRYNCVSAIAIEVKNI
eukprot:scaffold6_cov190-Alexandrium_tamarense.AAC.51